MLNPITTNAYILSQFGDKIIEDKCPPDYLVKVWEFAETTGQLDSLKKALEYAGGKTFFCRPAKLVLFKDFAPFSFEFTIQYLNDENQWVYGMNGGIIYHGKHDNGGDGGAPTYSVNITPQNGWGVHS